MMMVTQFPEHTKTHWSEKFKKVNCMIDELCVNKTVKNCTKEMQISLAEIWAGKNQTAYGHPWDTERNNNSWHVGRIILWHMPACTLHHFRWLFETSWTITRQTPLSMGFSRQEYWSGLSFPSPGDLPDPGIEILSPAAPALQVDSLQLRQ